jgi:uncharacterized membrane protein required for colicin V production
MQNLARDIYAAIHVNWFDFAVIAWLIFGFFRGRKHGMSQELLPLTQWIAVIVVAGMFYLPAAQLLVHYTKLTLLPCALAAYVVIGCTVYGLLGKLKKKLDDTFQEGDYFGDGEYYLGMTSGIVRFVCILLALLAVMNVRIITKAEREATLAMQKKNFEDIRFPTYGEVQNAVLFESSTGNFVRAYLGQFLIQPVNPEAAPAPKKVIPRVARNSAGSSTAGGGFKIDFGH